jgi:hypothetical protein
MLTPTFQGTYCVHINLFSPEDGDSKFLRNAGIYIQVHTVLLPRRYSISTNNIWAKQKQSHNTPMETQGGDDAQLLLIHDLGIR